MDKLLSTTDFSKLCGVSNDTVIREIKNGKIKAFRVGNRYKIPESELLKFKKVVKTDINSTKEKVEIAFKKAGINASADQTAKFINTLIGDII